MSAERPTSNGQERRQPYRRWTLSLMYCPHSVVVYAQSFDDAVSQARKQLEAWVQTATWAGYATGSSDADL